MKINYTHRIFGLDIVRATAILLVVFSHMRWIMPNLPKIIEQVLSIFGVLGVEIFFVLSGFLIGKILLNDFLKDNYNFNSVKYFWKRRWFRTLPNYFLILIINIFISKLIQQELPNSLWKYFFFLHNFSSELPPFFMESWSLSIEEFTYLLLPFSLLLLSFLKLKTLKIIQFRNCILLLLLLFFVSKVVYHFSLENESVVFWNINLRTTVIYRIDAIFYGVLASYFYITKKEKWYQFSNIFLIFGFLVLGVIHTLIAIGILNFTDNLFFWNVLYLPIISISIAFMIPYFTKIKTATKWILNPISFISITSYAIYLLHNSVVLHLMKHYYPVENLSTNSIVFYCFIYLLITLILSYVLYRFFEKPMTDLRENNSKKYSNEL
ncbi:acyltransferase family protein [Polaribacter cellanae]|uniref:Acyltransferase n=1 Tax=Polaribacter cellanae TaxID=2818493 RepID=A0A975CQ21_9FLAO|nr:acyltransferase [Polaribacter cellanae]QTE23404.1 acyltransferase [Polaribacter cellanae]